MNDKTCIFCKKELSNKQNTVKHQKICKKNPILTKDKKHEIDYIKLLTIIEEQKKEICELKIKLETNTQKLLEFSQNSIKKSKNLTNHTINNTQNNIIINTSQYLKDIISNLQPINFEDMKIVFENNLSNKYIDKGIEGLAQFICDVPCQNKFITTDYARKVITYKTSDQQIISDPKANMLLNTAIKQNVDTIIDKAEDRYKYWKSQVDDSRDEDIDPDETDLENKLHTKKLKTIAQRVKDNITVDSNDATNVIILKGVVNKSVNAIEYE